MLFEFEAPPAVKSICQQLCPFAAYQARTQLWSHFCHHQVALCITQFKLNSGYHAPSQLGKKIFSTFGKMHGWIKRSIKLQYLKFAKLVSSTWRILHTERHPIRTWLFKSVQNCLTIFCTLKELRCAIFILMNHHWWHISGLNLSSDPA